jgi:hypothetical protein
MMSLTSECCSTSIPPRLPSALASWCVRSGDDPRAHCQRLLSALLPRLEQQPPLALEEVDFAEPDCDPDPEAA